MDARDNPEADSPATTFNVVITRLAGPAHESRARLVAAGVPEAMAEQVIQTVPCVVKRGVPRETAERFQAALAAAGAEVAVQPVGRPVGPRSDATAERPSRAPRPPRGSTRLRVGMGVGLGALAIVVVVVLWTSHSRSGAAAGKGAPWFQLGGPVVTFADGRRCSMPNVEFEVVRRYRKTYSNISIIDGMRVENNAIRWRDTRDRFDRKPVSEVRLLAPDGEGSLRLRMRDVRRVELTPLKADTRDVVSFKVLILLRDGRRIVYPDSDKLIPFATHYWPERYGEDPKLWRTAELNVLASFTAGRCKRRVALSSRRWRLKKRPLVFDMGR